MDRGLKKFTVHVARSPFSDDKEKQKAYREVFSDELGSKVLQDILSEAGWFSPFIPQAKNPDNHSASIFDQGKKFVCTTILNTMTVKLKKEELEQTLTQQIDNYQTEGISYD